MCLTREVSRLLERSRDSSCSKRGPRTLDRASPSLWGRDWGRERVETDESHMWADALSSEHNVYTKQICVHTATTMHSSGWIVSWHAHTWILFVEMQNFYWTRCVHESLSAPTTNFWQGPVFRQILKWMSKFKIECLDSKYSRLNIFSREFLCLTKISRDTYLVITLA